MIIGIPKETMNHEHRVGLVPDDVAVLAKSGNHTILVEKDLGTAIGFTDEDYIKAGAKVVNTPEEAWAAELVVKCKEPLKPEYKYLRKDMTLYSFLDLAYSKELAQALMDSGVTSFCGETIPGPKGNFPVLAPMSEIAGKLAAQIIADLLCTHKGGRGILIGGSCGTPPAKVVVLGGGVVGMNAARVLVGMGADVTVLDIDMHKLLNHPLVIDHRVKALYATRENVKKAVTGADGVVGAVLVTGTQTPRIMLKEDLKLMNKGGVIVDVAADLGGCIETIHQTEHDNPTYEVDGIIHYGVPNMPGVVARTSSIAYSGESLPYVLKLANEGLKAALSMPGALMGLNAYGGKIALKTAAEQFGMPYFDAAELLK